MIPLCENNDNLLKIIEWRLLSIMLAWSPEVFELSKSGMHVPIKIWLVITVTKFKKKISSHFDLFSII